MPSPAKTSAGHKCLTILLHLFNFILWISGVAILAASIWGLIAFGPYMKLDNQHSFSALYILLGVGILIVLIGFVGCYGAMKGSRCLLGIYSVILIVIVLAEITLGIIAFVFKGDFEAGLAVTMKPFLQKYDTDVGIKHIVDGVQQNLECCGAQNYTQWFNTSWASKQKYRDSVPSSCCPKTFFTSGTKPNNSTGLCNNLHLTYNTGNYQYPSGIKISQSACSGAVIKFLESHLGIVAGIAVAIGVFQGDEQKDAIVDLLDYVNLV
ncbi:uncharacterized protein TRIADDRAFT_52174 [Trichoplax adhaerens]|uniref:Tetraspanin n=1 Tax=Trichoplax adhaerens TaxID=10228 RepID=B3RLZ1_TRIAD|nr:hypothetical protein TRIADDRAFT_52174 [Trichoplax adhaerens]EDV29608.1 hypothetical protein TRIADDRAFT_52174 [Trichoplax adhaerens]|eukprot:XP_002108810.1 hypothetical protein TRIADDRAFT_52174 [Trichoplax adhaerens]